jgi:hypothetical protein
VRAGAGAQVPDRSLDGQILGGHRQLGLEGLDIALEPGDVVGPALHAGPLALLVELLELQLEAHSVILRSKTAHIQLIPTPIEPNRACRAG